MEIHRSRAFRKPYIAVVFGDSRLRSLVTSCLVSFYRIREFSDVSNAITGCRADVPLLAVVGEELTPSGGFDFVRVLQRDNTLAATPVVMVVRRDDASTRDAVAACGAAVQLVHPFTRSDLISSLSGLLNRKVESKWKDLPPLQRQALTETLGLFNKISDVITSGEPILYQAVSEACRPLVEVVAAGDYRDMLNSVRDHDNYTYSHSMRVATYLALFGFALSLPKDEQLVLASGGLLHDVGKMSIPYEVLNKPGRLSTAEFTVMKGHVPASMAYLQGCHGLPKGIMTIAAQHHEKLDGTGYPQGLAAHKLNRLARMASIIDVFTALTDRRAYKPPMEPEAALNLMVEEMGSHLDIPLLGLFRQMLLDAARDVSALSTADANA